MPWLAAVLLLVLGGCGKNEFTVQVYPDPERPEPASLIYYASDDRQGWVVTQDLPIGMGTEKLVLVTHNPTVVFVTGSSRTRSCFYAERGDRLKLRCRSGFWTAEGNATNDDLAAWLRDNQKLVEADAGSALNAAIAKYVRANPGKRASAIILYVFYDVKADPEGFAQLKKLLTGDAASGELQHALGIMTPPEGPTSMPALLLRAPGDSAIQVMPRSARATIYLFWSNPERHADAALTLRRRLRGNKSVRVADINMQADTLNWSGTLRRDSATRWVCLWAPGAEQNGSLASLGLPGPDYLMVADGRARILYRGTDPAKAADKALSVK